MTHQGHTEIEEAARTVLADRIAEIARFVAFEVLAMEIADHTAPEVTEAHAAALALVRRSFQARHESLAMAAAHLHEAAKARNQVAALLTQLRTRLPAKEHARPVPPSTPEAPIVGR